MSTTSFSRVCGLLMALATPLAIGADEAPKCSRIAQDVTESVLKEPSKVLMIVEDALVINESCACEIVKAAIAASKADAPMVKQIVATAVAVAPKMSPIIIECANAASPGAPDVTGSATSSGKDAKSVQPVHVQEPESTSDYSSSGGGIRGVYLMAPAVGGFFAAVPDDDVDDPDEDDCNEDGKPRPSKPKPISPSCTCPDDQ